VHAAAEEAENLPAPQAEQDPAPEAVLNCPALHASHFEAPVAVWKVPAAQSVHLAAPAEEKVPAMQLTQAAATLTKPALQMSGEQALWPTEV